MTTRERDTSPGEVYKDETFALLAILECLHFVERELRDLNAPSMDAVDLVAEARKRIQLTIGSDRSGLGH